MTEQLPTLTEFEERLKRHNWMYQFSDAHNAFERGLEEERALMQICQRGGRAYWDLYQAYYDKAFSGDVWS